MGRKGLTKGTIVTINSKININGYYFSAVYFRPITVPQPIPFPEQPCKVGGIFHILKMKLKKLMYFTEDLISSKYWKLKFISKVLLLLLTYVWLK